MCSGPTLFLWGRSQRRCSTWLRFFLYTLPAHILLLHAACTCGPVCGWRPQLVLISEPVLLQPVSVNLCRLSSDLFSSATDRASWDEFGSVDTELTVAVNMSENRCCLCRWSRWTVKLLYGIFLVVVYGICCLDRVELKGLGFNLNPSGSAHSGQLQLWLVHFSHSFVCRKQSASKTSDYLWEVQLCSLLTSCSPSRYSTDTRPRCFHKTDWYWNPPRVVMTYSTGERQDFNLLPGGLWNYWRYLDTCIIVFPVPVFFVSLIQSLWVLLLSLWHYSGSTSSVWCDTAGAAQVELMTLTSALLNPTQAQPSDTLLIICQNKWLTQQYSWRGDWGGVMNML